jgi:hypothetical protein
LSCHGQLVTHQNEFLGNAVLVGNSIVLAAYAYESAELPSNRLLFKIVTQTVEVTRIIHKFDSFVLLELAQGIGA